MRYRAAIVYCRSLPLDHEVRRNLALAYDQAAAAAKVAGRGYARMARSAQKTIAALLQQDRSAETVHVQGSIFLHAERHEDALRMFRLAYRRKSHPGYLVSIANVLRRMNKSTQALRYYRRAEREGGLSKLMLAYNLVQTLQAMGRKRAAMREVENGLLVKPTNAFERQIQRELWSMV